MTTHCRHGASTTALPQHSLPQHSLPHHMAPPPTCSLGSTSVLLTSRGLPFQCPDTGQQQKTAAWDTDSPLETLRLLHGHVSYKLGHLCCPRSRMQGGVEGAVHPGPTCSVSMSSTKSDICASPCFSAVSCSSRSFWKLSFSKDSASSIACSTSERLGSPNSD